MEQINEWNKLNRVMDG
uniref:Uncharacterized protein n=1 Tax=Anguilla anguilla TaxID=7936 RepID=A0A0E9QNQ8_ANGAN